ncbi:3-deoxy-D-manno-octulosonic acid transferase [Asticcacaulis tiandongensis]|uniref:3-deoxy-D-manno-octulosonic acid transferase n=1 Tax=Asticcacaulis tiandongensis TaxID=2565365 RepID=UPI00112CF34B|nr:glycosyltransferase N-terminal domain-containing protein [Asticcacaulis tiandongensis]
MSVWLNLYGLVMRGFHGFAPGLLRRRAAKGKEDVERMQERLGRASVERPNGRLIWFHGVSVGESLSAIPLVNQLLTKHPDAQALVTSATTTSAEILKMRLPVPAIHQYAPIDTPQAVSTFLDHWKPDLAVFIESDIWPNLLTALDRRHVPRLLLSARITEKTARGWQRLPDTMRKLLSGYGLIMAQDSGSEQRLRALGPEVVSRMGPLANLKALGAPLADNAPERGAVKAQVGDRLMVLAASTHPTEENLIAHALRPVLKQTGALLIMVPRHPIRASDIRFDLEALGFNVAQRSMAEPLTAQTDIYLADTLGELGVFFRLADLVIMGGGFGQGVGGHNPLEAARLGKAVITGPDLSNWEGVYRDMFEAGCAFKVANSDELGFVTQTLFDTPQSIVDANARALKLAETDTDTLDLVWRHMAPFLPQQEDGHAA